MARPSKYKPEYNEQAKKLALLGATDKDIADFFDVTEDCITKWKKKHPKFLLSLKEGKADKDSKVVRSLHERATGYKDSTGKEYPPDTTSMIFWLKNRQPEKWRDKTEIDAKVSGNITVNIVTGKKINK